VIGDVGEKGVKKEGIRSRGRAKTVPGNWGSPLGEGRGNWKKNCTNSRTSILGEGKFAPVKDKQGGDKEVTRIEEGREKKIQEKDFKRGGEKSPARLAKTVCLKKGPKKG